MPRSPTWHRAAPTTDRGVGALPATEALKRELAEAEPAARRKLAWETALEAADAARDAGCAGLILMGLRFDTVVDESAAIWRPGMGRDA
ncbi:MAG: hypothetical protein ACE5GC_04890 [Acidimicrobiia bacterium]